MALIIFVHLLCWSKGNTKCRHFRLIHLEFFVIRQFEVIAVSTDKGIGLWHLGLNPDTVGRLLAEQVAVLSGHGGEVPIIMMPRSHKYNLN